MKKSGLIKIGLFAFTSSMALTGNTAIIINEIDYDQPGTDTAEFIELFNSGGLAVSLDNYSIGIINGRDSSSYRNIDRSAFNISSTDISSYVVMPTW